MPNGPPEGRSHQPHLSFVSSLKTKFIRTLGADAPAAAYLCDEAAARGAARRFCMPPVSPGPAREAYQPATTFSRVVEARLRADLKG